MSKNKINYIELLSTLEKIKLDVCHFIDKNLNKSGHFEIKEKIDKTLVTNVDIYISDLFKEKIIQKYPFLNFYSEEDTESFQFPMVILDPIDGTKELALGVGECAVSFGIYFSGRFDDERNFSWIFNPFNGFCISSSDSVVKSKTLYGKKFLALISRTESEKGLFENDDKTIYHSIGSIAYKLGLLAAGSADFVISRRPKNIWDIMAGSHICYKRGLKFKSQGKVIIKLEEKTINDNLVWYPEDIEEKIKSHF